jgi:hypothetical protein
MYLYFKSDFEMHRSHNVNLYNGGAAYVTIVTLLVRTQDIYIYIDDVQ